MLLSSFPPGCGLGGAVCGQGPHTSSLLCVTAGWGYGGLFPTSFSHLAILKNLSWNSQQGRETPCAQESQTLPKCAAGQRLRRRTYFQQGSQDTLLLFFPFRGTLGHQTGFLDSSNDPTHVYILLQGQVHCLTWTRRLCRAA